MLTGNIIVAAGEAGSNYTITPDISVSYLDTYWTDNNASTYNATLSFGTEASDRTLIVFAQSNVGYSTNISCTIGGVTATKVGDSGAAANGRHTVAFAANVATGTSGTVSINFINSGYHCFISIFRVTGNINYLYKVERATVDPTNSPLSYPNTVLGVENGYLIGMMSPFEQVINDPNQVDGLSIVYQGGLGSKNQLAFTTLDVFDSNESFSYSWTPSVGTNFMCSEVFLSIV